MLVAYLHKYKTRQTAIQKAPLQRDKAFGPSPRGQSRLSKVGGKFTQLMAQEINKQPE